MNMTAIIITLIICVTLIIMAYFGNQGNERKQNMSTIRKIKRNKLKIAQGNNKIRVAWEFYQKKETQKTSILEIRNISRSGKEIEWLKG